MTATRFFLLATTLSLSVSACQQRTVLQDPGLTSSRLIGASLDTQNRALHPAFWPKTEPFAFDFKAGNIYYREEESFRAMLGQLNVQTQRVIPLKELSAYPCAGLALHPETQQLAMAAQQTANGPLMLILQKQESQRQLAEITGQLLRLEWSRDGQKVAVLSTHFSPDKKEWIHLRVYATDTSSPLISIDEVIPGFPQGARGVARPELASLAWSPDSQRLAYTQFTGNSSEIALIDLQSGQRRPLTQHKNYAYQPVWSPDGNHIFYTLGRLMLNNEFNRSDLDLSDPDDAIPIGRNYLFSSRIYSMQSNGTQHQVMTPDWAPPYEHRFNLRQEEDQPFFLTPQGPLMAHVKRVMETTSQDPLEPTEFDFVPQLSVIAQQSVMPVKDLTAIPRGGRFAGFDPIHQRIYFTELEPPTIGVHANARLRSINVTGSDLQKINF